MSSPSSSPGLGGGLPSPICASVPNPTDGWLSSHSSPWASSRPGGLPFSVSAYLLTDRSHPESRGKGNTIQREHRT